MPQKIRCSKCDYTLYEGDILKTPYDIFEKFDGKCPGCKKEFPSRAFVYILQPGQTLEDLGSDYRPTEVNLGKTKEKFDMFTYRENLKTPKTPKSKKHRRKRTTDIVPKPPLKTDSVVGKEFFDIMTRKNPYDKSKNDENKKS